MECVLKIVDESYQIKRHNIFIYHATRQSLLKIKNLPCVYVGSGQKDNSGSCNTLKIVEVLGSVELGIYCIFEH